MKPSLDRWSWIYWYRTTAQFCSEMYVKGVGLISPFAAGIKQ